MTIYENQSLLLYNTFHIEASGRFFTEINNEEEFRSLIQSDVYQNNEKLILGGGSNLLLTKDFGGLVIKNNFRGIEVVKENDEQAWIKVGAGEVWHDFVLWCIDKGFGGLENLSLIPGRVGASPMQNIGAYGVEIKDLFDQLEALDMQNGEKKIFNNKDCEFGYRESVFKRKYKNKYLITTVTYCLNKKPVFNTTYGAIEKELEAMGVKDLSIKTISDAVIHIRSSKLPDPAVIGNAGSFFKNPEIDKQKHDSLKVQFPDLVSYPLPDDKFKLAAGWLIEQCGWKGHRKGDAGVHKNQALVLVNYDKAKGNEIYDLSTDVLKSVKDKFGVDLEREVNVI